MPSYLKDQDEIIKTLASIEGLHSAGQRIDRSYLHPFPARMPFCVADQLIKGTTLPGAVVLDPMAGSGTTLLAACNNGLKSFGFDRDPLAVLISRTLTQCYDSQQIDELKNSILDRAVSWIKKKDLRFLRSQLPKKDQEFIKFWFPNYCQKELFALSAAIKKERNKSDRDLAWVIFSSLIISKSAGASFALDISRTRPHKSVDKAILSPFEGWKKRFKLPHK
jgi:hypothetical protein